MAERNAARGGRAECYFVAGLSVMLKDTGTSSAIGFSVELKLTPKSERTIVNCPFTRPVFACSSQKTSVPGIVTFLVTPRIIAAVLMTPLLTIFSDLIGLLGGAVTMQTFAIPFSTFLKEVDSAVTMTDFMAGFVKSFVFATLVAGIGCLRGLQTAAGASAVGESATRAVVSGIILLVVVDGIFAVAYYMMNI